MKQSLLVSRFIHNIKTTIAMCQIFLLPRNLFYALLLSKPKTCVSVRTSQIVQHSSQLVNFGSGVYHGSFNMACNMAKATNFAKSFRTDAERTSARSTNVQHPYMQCTLPVESFQWTKAIFLIRKTLGGALLDTEKYTKMLGKELHRSIGTMCAKAKRKTYHLVMHDSGKVGVLNDENPSLHCTEYFDCKKEPYVY